MKRLAIALVFCASGATAAPATLNHTGYLLGPTDAPLDATTSFVFRLWNTATPGAVGEALVWASDACPLPVRAGFYAVELGVSCSTTALTTTHLPVDTTRWLEVTVDGATLVPRLAIAPPPAALRAHDSDLLGGLAPGAFAAATHTHTASAVTDFAAAVGSAITAQGVPFGSITGVTGTTAWPGVASVSRDATLAGNGTPGSPLGVVNGVVTTGTYANPAWITSLGASKLTGTVPAGVTWNGTAIADAYVAGASVWNAKVSSQWTTLGGDLTYAGGNVAIGSSVAPTARLEVTGNVKATGGVQVGTTGGATTCTSGEAGTIRWTGSVFQGCNGATWGDLGGGSSGWGGIGGSSANPATSCKAIFQAGATSNTPTYWIDPDGAGTGLAPFSVKCDMTTSPGGWTIVADVREETYSNPPPTIGNAGSFATWAQADWSSNNSYYLSLQKFDLLTDGTTEVMQLSKDSGGSITAQLRYASFNYNATTNASTLGTCTNVVGTPCSSAYPWKNYPPGFDGPGRGNSCNSGYPNAVWNWHNNASCWSDSGLWVPGSTGPKPQKIGSYLVTATQTVFLVR